MGEIDYSFGVDLASIKGDWTAISIPNCSWGINESAITTAEPKWKVIEPWETTTSNIITSNCINCNSVDTKPNVFRAKSKFRKITIK